MLIKGNPETEDPIPDFPKVKITDPFFAEIVGLIPVDPRGTGAKIAGDIISCDIDPAREADSDSNSDPDPEFLFRRWLKSVKTHYPKESSDPCTWLTAAWILFLQYGNSIWNSKISGTEYRKAIMWKLVDRFRIGFKKVRAAA